MDADYSKLWGKVKEKGIKNKTELIPMAGISTNILASLAKASLFLWIAFKRFVLHSSVMLEIFAS